MRYLVLSDIHANFIALEAVLKDARKRRWDRVIFLGDAVGYYCQPEEVIQQLQQLDIAVAILGNHDQMLLDMRDQSRQSENLGILDEYDLGVVRPVIKHHTKIISESSVQFLRKLKSAHVDEDFQATHGALMQQWMYLDSQGKAERNKEYLERPICLVGHTHTPCVFAVVETPKKDMWRTIDFVGNANYRIPPKAQLFFNPGSVGQPRDHDFRAAYAVFDDSARRFELYRIEFDIVAMQRLLRQENYPEVLGERLADGR